MYETMEYVYMMWLHTRIMGITTHHVVQWNARVQIHVYNHAFNA